MAHSHAYLKHCIIADRHELLALPGAQAVILGLKRKAGRMTGCLSVTVFVTAKLAPGEIPARHMVPKTTRVLFPAGDRKLFRLRSVPTDVVETGRIVLQAGSGNVTPIKCGMSIGPIAGNFGTLGCLVREKATGNRLALTNYHVAFQTGLDNSVICQPGALFGVDAKESKIGRTVGGKQSTAADAEHMDAAVVSLDATSRPVLDVFACPEVAPVSACLSADDFVLPMRVHKCGARTGCTEGIITHVVGDYVDVFPPFRSVITVQTEDDTAPPLSDEGDSGAVWIRRAGSRSTGEAVGLHFAGTDSGRLAFACPMWRVIGDPGLGIEL